MNACMPDCLARTHSVVHSLIKAAGVVGVHGVSTDLGRGQTVALYGHSASDAARGGRLVDAALGGAYSVDHAEAHLSRTQGAENGLHPNGTEPSVLSTLDHHRAEAAHRLEGLVAHAEANGGKTGPVDFGDYNYPAF